MTYRLHDSIYTVDIHVLGVCRCMMAQHDDHPFKNGKYKYLVLENGNFTKS